jgi:hypothetical protein
MQQETLEGWEVPEVLEEQRTIRGPKADSAMQESDPGLVR